MIGQAGATALLLLGLICVIMPAVTWVILARQHSPVVALWCVGYLLCASGLVLIGFRGAVPSWASFPVANILGFTGLLLSIQALRLDAGTPWRPGWMLVACLVYLLTYKALWLGIEKPALRVCFVSLTCLILLTQVAMLAWRIAQREQSTAAKAIAGSYLFMAMTMVVRLAGLAWLGGAASPHPLLRIVMTIAAGVLPAIVANVGFIGLALERSLRQQVEAAASQARLEERQLLGNEIAHLDRQRGFGLVAASLAHELNQPLTAILASAQAAQRGIAADRLAPAESLELLDKVVSNTRRISSISERIRSFIRPTVADAGPVDLEKITGEMLDLLKVDLRRLGIRVVFSKPALPILVSGDAVQLSQVVLNVLRNAVDAVQLVPDRSIHIQVTRSAGEAVLGIRDMGPGLDPGLAEQIGTPYFTTKEKGLGMGLSISTAILRQHKGSLVLRNAQGGGACVDIRLPILAAGGALA